MALSQYSETNISTSLAVYLADVLLADGYLIYWTNTDAVQTQAGWYYGWFANFGTYKQDPAVQAALAASKGLLTLMGKPTAKPVYPTRHTSDGSVAPDDEVQVPYLAVVVETEKPGRFSGLGDTMRERFRELVIFGAARDEREQSALCDTLVRHFDDSVFLPVQDYDVQPLATFGDVESQLPIVTSAVVGLSPEASRYEIMLNARLRYEA